MYKRNFPDIVHLSGNICGLSAAKMTKLGVQCILMSPPCQPFTRQGKQEGLKDPRTQPLVHLIDSLAGVERLQYVLVENVKGFETSDARGKMVEALDKIGFARLEFLLSPAHFGVPNSRLR